MFFYKECDEEELKKLSTLVNKGEKLRKSSGIIVNNIKYNQIEFYKTSMLGEELRGICFLDENLNIVEDASTINKLVKLGYYYDVFFNDTKKSIYNAILTEGVEEKEKYDESLILEAIKFLKGEGVQNLDIINQVLEKSKPVKIKMNSYLIELKKQVEEISESDTYGEEKFSLLYNIYYNIIMSNFESIKVVNMGADNYDELKTLTYKRRKKFNVRFNRRLVNPLIKLEEKISYFKNLLLTYERIAKISTESYKRFFKDKEDKEIKSNAAIVRKK